MGLKKYFTLLLLGLSTLAFAEATVYRFCVSSANFETFQAKVTFQSIDFGQAAAKQMVFNEVKEKLGQDVKIIAFLAERCACKNDCAVLEVKAKDWDGNFSAGDMSTATILGSAAEVADKVVTEAKRVFTDPGGYFKSYFTKSKVKVLKSAGSQGVKPQQLLL
jgi:hypothetical protein